MTLSSIRDWLRRRRMPPPKFTGSCPIREHTGDGYYVGRCDFATYDGYCPRHGAMEDYPTYDDREVAVEDRRHARVDRTPPANGPSVTQLAHFEMRLTALDKPTDRRRWNGGPMASAEADAALHEAVEAFQAALRARGFEVARTGYGVTATEHKRAR